MARQLVSLDIFKLDVIARQLKDVEHMLASSFKTLAHDHTEAARGGGGGGWGGREEVRGWVGQCKGIVRNIINSCLDETQKLHIGTTVQGHDSSLILDILEALRDIHQRTHPINPNPKH